jgi:uncharacterized protein (TIGR03435 family)
MNPTSLTTAWPAIPPALGPAFGNHLWQSTVFAVAAGILTLILRKNQARARYWLWMAASLKFLIPFSWLVALGSKFSWRHTPAAADPSLYVTIEQISQPFTQPATRAISTVVPAAASSGLAHLLPEIIAGIWLCGFVAVLLMWCLRWRRISAAIRQSLPLREGREIETLRRLERTAGIRQRIEMLLSRTTLEPGIFGMSRPVLVWPEGISQHLETRHLEAILAHELWHVRRRDNLAASLHMIVEAVFWFHPLVWWLGARLVDERERACDEEVLELGSERHIYAESILKVCEFCVGSPLACVSGVTGADLKKRMVHIMSEHVASKLDLRKKLLLTAAAVLAIAAPIVIGLVNATPSHAQSQDGAMIVSDAFDKVSITPSTESAPNPANAGRKNHMVRLMYGPDGFFAQNVTLRSVIEEAYGVRDNQLLGGPDWLGSATFNIEAKIDHPDGALPNAEKNQKMLQTLLAESTQLALHTEARQLQSYALLVAEGGPKLEASSQASTTGTAALQARAKEQFFMQSIKTAPQGQPDETHSMRMQIGDNQVVGMATQGISMADFANMLSRQLGVAVVDKTGLMGTYHFNLEWKPTADGSSDAADSNTSVGSAASNSSLLTAVQEQLGLKLEPQKGPTPVLVIDHIEKPSEN